MQMCKKFREMHQKPSFYFEFTAIYLGRSTSTTICARIPLSGACWQYLAGNLFKGILSTKSSYATTPTTLREWSLITCWVFNSPIHSTRRHQMAAKGDFALSTHICQGTSPKRSFRGVHDDVCTLFARHVTAEKSTDVLLACPVVLIVRWCLLSALYRNTEIPYTSLVMHACSLLPYPAFCRTI
jgi:hypothetical protein